MGIMRAETASTRQRILDAALRVFANHGYEGASVQQIVDLARATKPTLYYYFGSKAGLYEALVTAAQNARYERMKAAAVRNARLEDKLVEILDVLFRYDHAHRELTRLCFTTAFAAPGEVPFQSRFMKNGMRNYEFLRSLIQEGLRSGELDPSFDACELTTAIYGQIFSNAFRQVVRPKRMATRPRAERIVRIFLRGAAARGPRHR